MWNNIRLIDHCLAIPGFLPSDKVLINNDDNNNSKTQEKTEDYNDYNSFFLAEHLQRDTHKTAGDREKGDTQVPIVC